jgi:tRNA 2-selenouridine synthase
MNMSIRFVPDEQDGGNGARQEETAHVLFFLSLLERMPLLDVRSPAEFARGHIPGAVNTPLFDDAGRAEVGALYARVGQRAAFLRGLELAGSRLAFMARSAFAAWEGFPHNSGQLSEPPAPSTARPGMIGEPRPEIALHCWRGGMRSKSVAWLLRTAGLRTHVLRGGYKAFRRFVLASFEAPMRLMALGGRTGSGKTETLACLRENGAQVIDLESLAGHRGSAFGGYADKPQPSGEHFENSLAMALFRLDAGKPVWIEDESENLGNVNLPRSFYRQLRAAPLVLQETPGNARLARVLREYGDQTPEAIGTSLGRIQKRLGGLEHRRALEYLAAGDLPALARLLLAYYDRAYDKQAATRRPVAVIVAASPEDAARRILAECSDQA